MSETLFPIQSAYDHVERGYFTHPGIPWDVILPHEKQAQANHAGQSLQTLANRGGLGICEAVAILEDRPWRAMGSKEATERLNEILAQSREGKWEAVARRLADRLRQLSAACKRIEAPDIDWILPPTEVDEQILTDIEYHRTLADSELKAFDALSAGATTPAKP